MDGSEEVITVLKEIRDEARQTNVKLDHVNTRLDSIDGRLGFLDRCMSKGFDRLARQLDDHTMVIDHEYRIKTLESRSR